MSQVRSDCMTSWKTTPADCWDVAVVGGGPAGMTAAIAAARAGAGVALLERGDRPGKKLLMTGNGKCNLGNRDLQPSFYYSDNMAMAASVLERFGTEETMAFFASLGLLVRERRGGLYPASEQAAVVLDVLRYGLMREGVTMLSQAMVRRLSLAEQSPSAPKSRAGHYLLELENGRRIRARRVVLACGGQAAPRTGSDGNGYELAHSLGHRVISPVPALVQLHCGEKYCKALAGVRAEGAVRLYGVSRPGETLLEETGEIQFTEHGISGIPVFQLSGRANQLLARGWRLGAELDLFPGYEVDTYEGLCRRRLEQVDCGTVEMFFTGMLHKKIMQVCIREAGLSPEQEAAGA
ncbi:MAG: aminoacetone oxidase family FAD-binding enzyme, partial [Lachnospiraceae bacterium]|nr:aminoacetone oxidase family FAD-binding enzyme [Lachnospiraceae bacterium]